MVTNLFLELSKRLYVSPAGTLYSVPAIDDEWHGPFSSWHNVKTQRGAVGNGIANDTAAIQAAISGCGIKEQPYNYTVIYLPEGTYNIDATLVVDAKQNIIFTGEHPTKTKIKWVGAPGGVMFFVKGTWYSKFNRITWDGSGTAGVCIEQRRSYDYDEFFDTGNEYRDNIFENAVDGIRGGFIAPTISFAEVSIHHNIFRYLTGNGIIIGNFNALDVWVSRNIFLQCAVGVSNGSGGAGGYRGYRNNFIQCGICFSINDVVEFSLRRNYAYQCNQFLNAGGQPNPLPIVIETNRIVDCNGVAIQIGNHGPATIVKNIFKSKVGYTGYVIVLDTVAYNDLGQTHPQNNGMMMTMDNIFTQSNPIYFGSNTHMAMNAPVIVDRDSLTIVENVIPPTQDKVTRTIFEVPLNANRDQIQAILDQAYLLKGQRPVVHIPFYAPGYSINGTLTMHEGCDTQIVGDGYSTKLLRKVFSSAPMFAIAGPTKVSMKWFWYQGIEAAPGADGILLTNVDQVGARIFGHQFEGHGGTNGVHADGLDHAEVRFHDSQFTFCTDSGVKVTGGPLANAGTPAAGKTIVYAGLSFVNQGSFRVEKNGYLILRDHWYEYNQPDKFLISNGKARIVLDSSRIANHPMYPSVTLNDLDGYFHMIGGYMTNDIVLTGNGANAKVLYFGGEMDIADASVFIKDQTTSGSPDIRMILNRVKTTADLNPPPANSNSGSRSRTDVGTVNLAYMQQVFADINEVDHDLLTPKPANVTDFRMDGVWCGHFKSALHIKGDNKPLEYTQTRFISSTGNDSANGQTEATAWASFANLSSTFNENTQVLIKGGDTINGHMNIWGGTGKVRVSSYGTGKGTIAADGIYDGIFVHNRGNVKIDNIKVQGSGMLNNDAHGIICYLDGASDASNIEINNVDATGFGWRGIAVGSWETTYGFNNVAIKNCKAYLNGRAGIATHGFETNLNHQNVTVDNCETYQNHGLVSVTNTNTGSGIVIAGVDGGEVKNCLAYDNGMNNRNPSGGPVGIWAYQSKNVAIRDCESHHNKAGLNIDGGGFDLDLGCVDCVIERCYSHDNEGPGYMLCTLADNTAFSGNKIRFNVSENDGRKNSYGGLHIFSNNAAIPMTACEVHNNTFIVNAANVVNGTPTAIKMGDTDMNNVKVRNNIFYITAGVNMTSGTVQGGHILFQKNNYYSEAGAYNASAFDSAALNVNPQFAADFNIGNAALKDAALDLGFSLGSSDYHGNSITLPVNIGAVNNS